MTSSRDSLPAHYLAAIRSIIKFSIVMTVVGLLSGVLFQESAKKLSYEATPLGAHLEAGIHLALVHGHTFLVGVLVPLAMAGMLLMARKVGGSDVSPKPLKWLTRGYLSLASVALGLMLYKGYHYLLSVRGGETDLATINDSLFGGQLMARHIVYGVVHTGMAVSLVVFAVAIWRSLKSSSA